MSEIKACQEGITLSTRMFAGKRELLGLVRRASASRYGPSEETRSRIERVKVKHREDRAELEAHQADCPGCAKLGVRVGEA